ncbi:MAG TPA: hypothetical protein VMV59_12475 [Candidatus Dormibacteraeota bacterium]|nr:hypothetical protein [Candidatus Dormibacteraeota bacterium]
MKTRLCTSLPIKDWVFRGVFGGFRALFGLWYAGRVIEFSLGKG